jgi:hypothetical protein
VIEASQALFSLETLIITVSAGAVAALVVGFVTGYCCGRRCHKDDNTLVSIGLYFICKQRLFLNSKIDANFHQQL